MEKRHQKYLSLHSRGSACRTTPSRHATPYRPSCSSLAKGSTTLLYVLLQVHFFFSLRLFGAHTSMLVLPHTTILIMRLVRAVDLAARRVPPALSRTNKMPHL